MPYDPGAAARHYPSKQGDCETERRLRLVEVDLQTLRAVESTDDAPQIERRVR